jgi:hypothetical protein
VKARYLVEGFPGHPLHPPFVCMTLGGWLGGTIVFVHGMRVLGLVREPFRRAITPGPPETARAAS